MMAKKIKISRKQMKKPDEFISWSEKAWDWAEENILIVGIGVVAFVVLFLLVETLIFWSRGASDSPRAALASAVNILRAPVELEDDQPFLPGRSAGYQSEEEKYDAAAAAFRKVIDEHPESLESQMAMLYLARAYERLGRIDSAIELYDNFMNSEAAGQEPSLKESAVLGVARLHYREARYAKALESFEKIASSDSAFKLEAKLNVARCQYRMGNKDAAKDTLGSIKKESPDSLIAHPADFLAKYWEKKIKEEQDVEENSEGEALEIKESSIELGSTTITVE